jgi:hypothetical protein
MLAQIGFFKQSSPNGSGLLVSPCFTTEFLSGQSHRANKNQVISAASQIVKPMRSLRLGKNKGGETIFSFVVDHG